MVCSTSVLTDHDVSDPVLVLFSVMFNFDSEAQELPVKAP